MMDEWENSPGSFEQRGTQGGRIRDNRLTAEPLSLMSDALCQISRPLTEDLRLVWDSKSLPFDLVPIKRWESRHRGPRGWQSVTGAAGRAQFAVRYEFQHELRHSPAERPRARPLIPQAPFSLCIKRGDVLALLPQKLLGGSGYGAGKWVAG